MPPTTPTAARHVRRPPSRAATAALVALTLLVVPGPPADAVPAAERADRAGSTTAAARVSDPALARSLAAVMRDSRVRHGSSATVADTAGGAVLYSRYGSTARTPASNLKLVTAAAAMDTLGPGYRFRTEVLRVAAVRNGVLGGDLWIKGYGDPTTRQQDYASLARQVRAAGIRRVSGHLDVDVSWFDGQSYHPAWSRG
ncbi:D-alanyl-D-alanine carboxypeptidase [Friedmanniella endophytica]|uniref:D-alanyl-D-alanine carboxypeptidase n=1 Tax=Microlunatus kandeliicorticis TaxID=1759536 RepID=A0A7W3ISP7_9ACTN|nr:D-alanyl-D-alanine carboxypeptidase [Microlunatus kandeliicorticis]